MNDIIDSLRRKSAKVRQLFATDRGREVLKILADEFDNDELRGDSVEETYYNLGQRDVIVYIRQLIEADINNG